MTHTVYVIDDDDAITTAICALAKSLNIRPQCYKSALEFLDSYQDEGPACLILDVRLPNQSGLELQKELKRLGREIPIIFISGYADVPLAVEAMKAGALTLLEKPIREQTLCEELQRGLQLDEQRRARKARRLEAESRLAQLTEKEREVMDLLVLGHTNSEIAEQLQLSVRAIEERRARLTEKLEVTTLAELIALSSALHM